MKRKSVMYLAKTIIFFSFVVIFSGIAFDFTNNKKLINPEMDTYVLTSNEEGTVSITVADPKDKKDKTNKTKDNTNNNTVNNNSNTVNTRVNAKETLRNSIKNKYGINVKYGNETNGYEVAKLKVVSLTNDNEIYNSLKILDRNLSYYPNNFFKEIKNSGFNVTIYLIKKYSKDNVTGITDSTNKNVIISIATQYQFEESIHHELYHYIEKYMYSKGARYTTWDSLNPANFKYGNPNSSLSYNYTYSSDAPFVNNYAQTAADEKEALVKNLLEKVKRVYFDAIRINAQGTSKDLYQYAVFASVKPSTKEFWERYVY